MALGLGRYTGLYVWSARPVKGWPREAMEAKIHGEHRDRQLGTFAAYALLLGCIRAQR